MCSFMPEGCCIRAGLCIESYRETDEVRRDAVLHYLVRVLKTVSVHIVTKNGEHSTDLKSSSSGQLSRRASSNVFSRIMRTNPWHFRVGVQI